jgi:hypothetical protein
MPRVIEMNSLRCKNCGDIIVSTYRHEMVTCLCGDISVDGGTDYCKISIKTDAKGYLTGRAILDPWPILRESDHMAIQERKGYLATLRKAREKELVPKKGGVKKKKTVVKRSKKPLSKRRKS